MSAFRIALAGQERSRWGTTGVLCENAILVVFANTGGSLGSGIYAAKPDVRLSTRKADGTAVTVCRLPARVALANEDPLGKARRAKLSRADRAATRPASFLGPSGHSPITSIR